MALIDIDDLPATEPDFSFDTLAKHLAALLERKRASAFVLGLHGPWGSGKTTLLNGIRRQLSGDAIIVEFNAWKYQDREALWRALILRVLNALEQNGGDKEKIAQLQRSLYESFTLQERGSLKVNWTAAITESLLAVVSVASLGIGGSWLRSAADAIGKVFSIESGKEKTKEASDRVERVAKVFERQTTERAVQRVVSIEQFLEKFRTVTANLGQNKRVHVLIDDLDRCLPESALEIFEATKLFLDAPECSYVVAVDRAVIRRGLELRYPRRFEAIAPPVIDADEYIEKTITLSFDLPLLADADAQKLIHKAGLDNLTEKRVRSIIEVLGTNPRRLKRFSTMLRLWLDLAEALPEEEKKKLAFFPAEEANQDLFLKLALIGYLNSGLLNHMQRDSALSDRLQIAFNAAAARSMPVDGQRELAGHVQGELPLVREAVLEPALLRAMKLGPNLAGNATVDVALRWFRNASGQ
jgi:predicted KAP-like P-loop ATPase